MEIFKVQWRRKHNSKAKEQSQLAWLRGGITRPQILSAAQPVAEDLLLYSCNLSPYIIIKQNNHLRTQMSQNCSKGTPGPETQEQLPKTASIEHEDYSSKPKPSRLCQPLKKPNYRFSSGQDRGKWTLPQQKKYLTFLRTHLQKMREPDVRKVNKMFVSMSKQIKSRTANQCRSHHQKMMLPHASVEEGLRYLTAKVFGVCAKKEEQKEEVKEEAESKPIQDKQGLYKMWVLEGNVIRIIINQSAIGSF